MQEKLSLPAWIHNPDVVSKLTSRLNLTSVRDRADILPLLSQIVTTIDLGDTIRTQKAIPYTNAAYQANNTIPGMIVPAGKIWRPQIFSGVVAGVAGVTAINVNMFINAQGNRLWPTYFTPVAGSGDPSTILDQIWQIIFPDMRMAAGDTINLQVGGAAAVVSLFLATYEENAWT